jgi:hypothetical protein
MHPYLRVFYVAPLRYATACGSEEERFVSASKFVSGMVSGTEWKNRRGIGATMYRWGSTLVLSLPSPTASRSLASDWANLCRASGAGALKIYCLASAGVLCTYTGSHVSGLIWTTFG